MDQPLSHLTAGDCLGRSVVAIYITLSVIDFLIAAVAFCQLVRLYLRSHNLQCNRQKVFHCLIGASNLGYLLFFVLTPIAKCAGWSCWSHACGFAAMAVPQIIFLATFLLLLSFWLDLCHQATDREDDDVDEEHDYVVLPSQGQGETSRRHHERNRKCCPCLRFPRIRSRQKFVIGVIILIGLLTAAFAVLIWIGTDEDNPINSAILAQIYSDIFAIVIMISGGGLAGYGLMLYHKMKRVRSDTASRDLRKVAGLAVVSVVCFSLRAILVLFTDIPALDLLRVQHFHRDQYPALLFLYFFVGESIPSGVVLWVMRELPSRSADVRDRRSIQRGTSSPIQEETLIQHLMNVNRQTIAGIFTNARNSPPNTLNEGRSKGDLLC